MVKRRIYNITEFQYKREITKRYTYPFYSLNKITGGAEVGSLDILFSKTNSGKSELLMQFICNWIKQGEKVCAMLGEHTMRKAQSILYKKVTKYDKDKWITVDYGKDNEGKDLGIRETFINDEDLAKAEEFFNEKLYLYDTRCGFTMKSILEAFEDGYNEGCTVFCLDNQMMVDYEGQASELREQADNTEKLRQWAKEHQVVVYLVAHARKIDTDRIRLFETDINGSSNVSNKATTIITITRTNTLNPNAKEYKAYSKLLELNYIDITKCDAILEVVKEKNGKGVGFVPLKWYESTKTFVEVYDEDMNAKKKENQDRKTILYAPKQMSAEEVVFKDLTPLENFDDPF